MNTRDDVPKRHELMNLLLDAMPELELGVEVEKAVLTTERLNSKPATPN